MKRTIFFLSCLALLNSCSNSGEKSSDSDQFRESQVAAAAQQGSKIPAVVHTTVVTDTHSAMDSTAAGMEPAKTTAEAPKSGSQVIEINVIEGAMRFDTKQFTVKAGQKVIINFNNPDSQQHNLVIARIGALNKVGSEATKMISEPDAMEKGYVPDIPEVIIASPLLGADASYTLEFTAPGQPGDYPFLCTFPGHWMMMNGIMKVIK